ncbi:hypothetical protein EZS27_039840, partial [termite gut metagenome]
MNIIRPDEKKKRHEKSNPHFFSQ